jgi:DNA methylase N-4/N-6:parB-like nuclease
MELKDLQIENVALSEIKPYKHNAKKHDEKQIGNVAESIYQFGWQQPLVLDKDKVIIIGHCRYLAAKKLKLKTVPCKIAADLTADEVKKLRALDNKLNESEWDLDMLSLDIGGLDFKGFDVDWGIIKPDDFGTEFAIASGDKSVMETMTFTLHHEQAELIRSAMETVLKNEEAQETFGNTNRNGNAIYEVVRQWAEQRK